MQRATKLQDAARTSEPPSLRKSDPGRSTFKERLTIATAAIKTVAGLSLGYYVLYYHVPIPVPSLPQTLDRLIYTLRFQTFPCLTLIVGILVVALTRLFTTAIDPINGGGEHHVAVYSRYLTNTVEQFLVSFVGQLILATFLQEHQMKNIPILAIFFVFGRVAFFFGYRKSYLNRTTGFVATFLVSIVVWIVVVYHVVSSLFS
ncbi:transmembrane protein 79-like [Physella acuta]|uniref:transmembrane protein 79-like n=1 Tax=Physella acuta TaxID=109671 RepID=UPI0027DCAF2E|nr:transmembrane protein 79-like [Physella acuta]